jgi:hypothetical protein
MLNGSSTCVLVIVVHAGLVKVIAFVARSQYPLQYAFSARSTQGSNEAKCNPGSVSALDLLLTLHYGRHRPMGSRRRPSNTALSSCGLPVRDARARERRSGYAHAGSAVRRSMPVIHMRGHLRRDRQVAALFFAGHSWALGGSGLDLIPRAGCDTATRPAGSISP